MKIPKEDFHLIRTAAMLLAAAIALGGLGIVGSIYLKEMMQRDKIADQKRLAETRNRLELVREEEQRIRLYHKKFLKLEEQGILERENRLAWVESLAQIKEDRRLFKLDYEVEAQQPVQADASLSRGNLGLYGSTVKLGLTLLHEEDLFHALDDFRKRNRGLSLVRECSLTRLEKDTTTAVSPGLEAECTLVWLSLKPKVGRAGQ